MKAGVALIALLLITCGSCNNPFLGKPVVPLPKAKPDIDYVLGKWYEFIIFHHIYIIVIHLDKLESQQTINQLQTEMIMKQSRAIERLELIVDDLEWMLCDYDPYLCLKDQPAKIK